MAILAFYTQGFNYAEKIGRSIESVLNQTFTDFTYYIADDGSTDGTKDVIMQYAKKDSRIVPIFSTENSPCGTYNMVLQKIYNSDAKYLATLDDDDWYEPTFAQTMLDIENETDADFIICGHDFIDESTNTVYGERRTLNSAFVEKKEYASCFIHLHQFLRTFWAKLYKLDILRENKIFLPENIVYGRDTAFVLNYFKYTNNFFITDKILHHYLVRKRAESYVFYPERIDYDITLSEITLDCVSHLDALSNENRAFLAKVNLHALLTSFKAGLNTNKLSTIAFNTQLTDFIISEMTILNNCHQSIVNDSFFCISSSDKSIFLHVFSVFYNNENLDSYFSLLTSICPAFADFWDESDVDIFLTTANDIKTAYLTADFENALDLLNKNQDNDTFCLLLKTHLETMLDSSFHTAALCLKGGIVFSQKQQEYLCQKNTFLQHIENSGVFFSFPALLSLIFEEKYDKVLDVLPDFINAEFDNNTETSYSLTKLGLFISAKQDKVEHYIFFLKAEVNILAQLGNRDEYSKKLENLAKLIPQDDDLINLSLL